MMDDLDMQGMEGALMPQREEEDPERTREAMKQAILDHARRMKQMSEMHQERIASENEETYRG